MERLGDLTRTIQSMPPGLAFARFAMALAAAGGDAAMAAKQARRHERTTPAVVSVLQKAATDVGDTISPTWAAPLVDFQALTTTFVEATRAASILGRLTGWRPVPFATRTLATSDAASAAWVGERLPIPASSRAFENVLLGISKVASLVVLTQELVKSISSAAEESVRQELVATVAEFVDRALIDPTLAEIAGTSPASLTHGLTPLHSTGSSVAAITSDLAAVATSLVLAGSNLASAGWIAHPRTCIYLSALRDSAGALAFPTVGARGGSLMGMPLIASAGIPLFGSPQEASIVLLDPSRVLLADDGKCTVDTTTKAAVQLRDDPVTGAAQQASLWQLGLVGVRVHRFINWRTAGASAAAILDRVTY